MKEQIIEMLNKDLEDEHAAVIQYLVHAYSMGEGEMACEIEAIAREEMRHFDWLAEAIVSLGGIPSVKRGGMRTGGASVAEWMQNNVLQEKDAISEYEAQIAAIEDPKIKRLLERILSDERSHHDDFAHFVDKADREQAVDRRGDNQDDVVGVLNWGIEHEYTVVLQYLLHSYMASRQDVKDELQDQAINEMQHLGWLAEKMVDRKGAPTLEASNVFHSADDAEMLQADIRIEKEVAAEYERAAKAIDDPGVAALLERIRDHEIYHIDVFGDLLKDGS